MQTVRHILLAFFAPILIASTAGAVPTDFQDWTQVSAMIPLEQSRRYELYFEAQTRIGDDWQRMERVFIRPALVYNWDKNLSFALGYVWAPGFYNAQYYYDYRIENRIWEQILYKHGAFGLQWQHRLRQEQRFIEDTSGTSNRLRYLVRGSYALDESKTYGLTAFNELFVTYNTTSNGPQSGFDRDRVFIGPYFIRGSGRYEVGYVGEFAKHFGNNERFVSAILLSANYDL